MIVTVSDTSGIKQYNVPSSIKKIILSLFIIIILIIGGLSYYVKILHEKLSFLEKNIQIEKKLQATREREETLRVEQLKKAAREKELLAMAKKVEEEKHLKLEKLKQEKLLKEKLAKEKQKKEALAKAKKLKLEKAKKEKAKQERLAKEKQKKEALAKAKKLKLEKAKTKKRVTKKETILPKIAKSKLGKRYVWGAVGPGTFDCSGFTSYIYSKTGIRIPRTSRQQSKYGKLVDRKHLKVGDLIFFDTSRRRKGVVNHVGMYIGDNKFIHASSAKKRVVITRLSNFYSQRFKWARRVIN